MADRIFLHVLNYEFPVLQRQSCYSIISYLLTWVTERPRSVHVADIGRDADGQDTMYQCDEATVPLIAPGSVDVTQEEVERDPTGQTQKRRNNQQCHLHLACRQSKQVKKRKSNSEFTGSIYSRKTHRYPLKQFHCAVLCKGPTNSLCLNYNSTIVGQVWVWWSEGDVSSSYGVMSFFPLWGKTQQQDLALPYQIKQCCFKSYSL